MKIIRNFNKLNQDKKFNKKSSQFSIQWNNAIGLTDKGDILLKQNKPKEALFFYDRAINECITYPIAYFKKGELLTSMNKKIEAIEVFDQLISINNKSFEAWYFRGLLFYEIDKKLKALDSFNESIEIEANNGDVWQKRGDVLLEMGKNDVALESFKKAVELGCEFEDQALNNIGVAYLNMGELEKALASFEKAIEINSEIDIYKENIELVISEITKIKKTKFLGRNKIYLILLFIISLAITIFVIKWLILKFKEII